MTFIVLAPDGARYGPIDVPTLRQWAMEGRVAAHWMLQPAGGGPALSVRQVLEAPEGYRTEGQAPPPRSARGTEVPKSIAATSVGLVLCAPGVLLGLYYAHRAKKNGEPGANGALAYAWGVLAFQAVTLILLAYLYSRTISSLVGGL